MAWTHLTDVPGGSFIAAPIAALGGKLYVVNSAGAFKSFDLSSSVWADLTPPAATGDNAAFLVGNNGLIYYVDAVDFTTFSAYDPATDTWADKTPYTGNPGTRNSQYITDGATIWVVVLDRFDTNPNGPTFNLNGITNVAAYDIATDTWDSGAVIPVPVAADGLGWGSLHWTPAATDVGGPCLVYVNGWWDQDAPVGETCVLDLTDVSGGWVSGSAESVPREDQAQGSAGSGLYFAIVVGGDNDSVGSMASAQAYDPYRDEWTSLANLPVAMDGPGLTVAGSVIYVLADGGASDGIYAMPFSDLPHGGSPPPPLPSPVAPTIDLEISDTVIPTPGFLTVNVSNVPPGGSISFRLDVDNVLHECDTAFADDDGNLLRHRVFIDHVLADGTHTLYANNADVGSEGEPFTVDSDEIAGETLPGPTAPVLIPHGIGVLRWYFQDPTGNDPDHYQFPRNPEKYTTPYADKVLSYDFTADPVNGRPITTEGAPVPVEWSFSGKLFTKDEEAQFVYWFTRPYRIYIVDHENRAYTVYLKGFDITPAQTMQHIEKRDYTMKATLYSVPEQL